MFLRELFEAPKKVAVTAFGRLNPPTIGHEKLVEKVKSFEGDHYIFLSQTQKPKDNPLPFDVKLEFAKKFFPGVNVGHPSVRTPIQMLQMLEKLGYTDIIYVAGSDRVASFEKLFNDYNGKEYNFDSITVENAGERDPDADGAEGMSASKMRAAAAAGDLESFAQGVPTPALAQKMYDAVRTGMGIKDEVPANEILGFATKSPKRATIKKKRPPEEDSVQDKLKKRRAMAAKGNPDAYKTGSIKEGDLVLNQSKLRSFIIDMISDKINQTDDVEQLAKWLKLIVGKEVAPRGANSYTISSEDVVEALSKRQRRG